MEARLPSPAVPAGTKPAGTTLIDALPQLNWQILLLDGSTPASPDCASWCENLRTLVEHSWRVPRNGAWGRVPGVPARLWGTSLQTHISGKYRTNYSNAQPPSSPSCISHRKYRQAPEASQFAPHRFCGGGQARSQQGMPQAYFTTTERQRAGNGPVPCLPPAPKIFKQTSS